MATLVSRLRKLQKEKLKFNVLKRKQREVIAEYQDHPLVAEAMASNPVVFLEHVLDLYEEQWTSFKPLIPHRKNKRYNAEVRDISKIFDSAEGFRTEGVIASDNPLEPAAGYSAIMGMVWQGIAYGTGGI
ncbi:MAG TPA: hypothetical protein VJH97_03935 [Candidatus Nanoarchaeia archaeon]|nr:hypothetical protein [Candidatus Nanoarchaeia archaeon]